MTSNSKHQKLYKELNARQRNDVTGIHLREIFHDRLTNLPSSLRTKILSCLPTRYAVMTSILSTEWKRSWTSVTNLDFNDNSVKRLYSMHPHGNDDFTSFVNRVLLLHDRSCLQRFRMKCLIFCKGSLVNAWIAAALLSNIKELDLSIRCEDLILLPSDIFLCNTLVVLKLDTSSYVYMPASVCLPGLKTLHLSKVKLSDDLSIVSLLSGCAVLEDLRLSFCVGKDVRVVNIISPTLTSLTMEDLPYCVPIGDYNYRVVIDTPSLKYLKFSDYVAQGYALKNLNHLNKAEINVGGSDDEDEESLDLFVEFDSKPITDFLIGVSQVQSLVLSFESTEAIYLLDVALPIFCNLTYLELDTVPGYLLENSPCLETLHIRKGGPYKFDETELLEYGTYFRIDYVPPSCFQSHLKVIKIDEFKGLKHERPMVDYFLRNAIVLEKLTIRYQSSGVDIEADAKQLLMFPRSSIICKVEIL